MSIIEEVDEDGSGTLDFDGMCATIEYLRNTENISKVVIALPILVFILIKAT